MKTRSEKVAAAETTMRITQKSFGNDFHGLFHRMDALLKAFPNGRVLSADDSKARTIGYLFEVPGTKENGFVREVEVKISIPLIEISCRRAFGEGVPREFMELIRTARGRAALADMATEGHNPLCSLDLLKPLVKKIR